jgi:predicted HicB family RNase H-like nuclease
MATIYLRNVPEDLHRQIKSEAALQGVTLQDLVIKVLAEYLKRVKKGE